MEKTLTTDSVDNYIPELGTLARTLLVKLRSERLGFTVNWAGGDLNPRNAFTVGGVVPSLVIDANGEDATLALVHWLAINSPHRDYAPIGAWFDNGRYYFDLVIVLPFPGLGLKGMKLARDIAKSRGELAFGEFDAYGNYAATHYTRGD